MRSLTWVFIPDIS